jgi:hypothetical protein
MQRCEKAYDSINGGLNGDDEKEALPKDVVKDAFGEKNELRVGDGSSREWLFSWFWGRCFFRTKDFGRQGLAATMTITVTIAVRFSLVLFGH